MKTVAISHHTPIYKLYTSLVVG